MDSPRFLIQLFCPLQSANHCIQYPTMSTSASEKSCFEYTFDDFASRASSRSAPTKPEVLALVTAQPISVISPTLSNPNQRQLAEYPLIRP
jgi:hypothetical protein